MDQELYNNLKDYIQQSTQELERHLLNSVESTFAQHEFSSDNTLVRFNGNDIINETFNTITRSTARGNTLTLERLGRQVLNKAGRSIGTDIGNALSGVLFGSTSSATASPRQFRDDILSSLFK